jgi:NADH:ubiquinone oxidoreductase subunit H
VNHMQKLKFEMGHSLAMAGFGVIVTSISLMLFGALHGHVTEDIAQRDWALSWAWFLVKAAFVYAIVMAFVLAAVRTRLKKKR